MKQRGLQWELFLVPINSSNPSRICKDRDIQQGQEQRRVKEEATITAGVSATKSTVYSAFSAVLGASFSLFAYKSSSSANARHADNGQGKWYSEVSSAIETSFRKFSIWEALHEVFEVIHVDQSANCRRDSIYTNLTSYLIVEVVTEQNAWLVSLLNKKLQGNTSWLVDEVLRDRLQHKGCAGSCGIA